MLTIFWNLNVFESVWIMFFTLRHAWILFKDADDPKWPMAFTPTRITISATWGNASSASQNKKRQQRKGSKTKNMTASLGIGTGTPGYEMKLAPAAVRSSFLFAEPKMRTLQKFVHMAGQERVDKKDPMSVSSKFQRLLVILVQNISEVLPSCSFIIFQLDLCWWLQITSIHLESSSKLTVAGRRACLWRHRILEIRSKHNFQDYN